MYKLEYELFASWQIFIRVFGHVAIKMTLWQFLKLRLSYCVVKL